MKRFAVACAVAACIALVQARAGAQTQSISTDTTSLAQYARSLQDAARQLESSARAFEASAHAPRGAAVPAIPSVHVPPAPLPGPPRFSPSLDDWLQAVLNHLHEEKKPANRAVRLRAAAATLRMAAETALATQVNPPHDIAPVLASILAQSAYHQNESTEEAQVHKSLWQRFLEWLAALIDRLFSGLFGVAASSPLLGRIIGVAAIALIALLVVFIAYHLARQILARRRPRLSGDPGEPIPSVADASQLYELALAAAARGHHAQAISLAFRASLMLLDGKGLIAYDPARTAGEYRRAVRKARAAAASSFDDLARTFTLATYAEAPTSEDDWSQAHRAYRRLEPLVEQAGRS